MLRPERPNDTVLEFHCNTPGYCFYCVKSVVLMQQYGAKLLQGLGYLRRLGGLPEGVLAAGQTGSSLVFLFGVIGVDAGRASSHPSIQVSRGKI